MISSGASICPSARRMTIGSTGEPNRLTISVRKARARGPSHWRDVLHATQCNSAPRPIVASCVAPHAQVLGRMTRSPISGPGVDTVSAIALIGVAPNPVVITIGVGSARARPVLLSSVCLSRLMAGALQRRVAAGPIRAQLNCRGSLAKACSD
jgi:hypothetical protein